MPLVRQATDAASAAPKISDAISAADAEDLARVFKALADPVRLRLLSMISSTQDGEICVCYLTEAFELTAPTISYHLKLLRTAGLITGERRGTWVYYRVVPDALARLGSVFDGHDLTLPPAGRSRCDDGPGRPPGTAPQPPARSRRRR